MAKNLDPTAGVAELFPQEFARVLVNLINNGFATPISVPSRVTKLGLRQPRA